MTADPVIAAAFELLQAEIERLTTSAAEHRRHGEHGIAALLEGEAKGLHRAGGLFAPILLTDPDA